MQPLFAHQPVLLSVLLASLLIWRVMEASVDIRTRKRLRAGTRRQDKGSHAVLICLVTLGILLGTLLAFTVPATAITSARTFLFRRLVSALSVPEGEEKSKSAMETPGLSLSLWAACGCQSNQTSVRMGKPWVRKGKKIAQRGDWSHSIFCVYPTQNPVLPATGECNNMYPRS